MSKPTHASVTEELCACGYLSAIAGDPNVPVTFNVELNEYHVEYEKPQGGRVSMVLYHCPFCGGAAPASRRKDHFAVVSDQEARRLYELARDIKTDSDVVRILGTPDDDRPITLPPGIAISGPEPRRAMTFSRLSEVADLQVMVHSNGTAEVIVAGKYLGPSHLTRPA